MVRDGYSTEPADIILYLLLIEVVGAIPYTGQLLHLPHPGLTHRLPK